MNAAARRLARRRARIDAALSALAITLIAGQVLALLLLGGLSWG